MSNFKIGSITLDNPFILAPLAGYTDLPFRLLCREYGAGLCYSEMISCHGLVYDQAKTVRMLDTHLDERPVAIQLFGAEPEIMGQAAAILAEYPIDIIDINMGCPVRKVVKRGSGSALMKTPELAEEIIWQCCKAGKPVTVKFRSGWTHKEINAPEFAQMAERAGARALTIHARTWSDGFSGHSDWQIIKKVKESVSIPVIGNGDILSYDQGLKMLEETGCDAVMIGRGSLGAPWVFQDRGNSDIPLSLRVEALLRHLELINIFYRPGPYLGRVKNHAGRYFKGARDSAAIRKTIYDCKTFLELTKAVEGLG